MGHAEQLRALAEAHLRLAAYHAAGAPGSDAEEEALHAALRNAVRTYPPTREAISSGNETASRTPSWKPCANRGGCSSYGPLREARAS